MKLAMTAAAAQDTTGSADGRVVKLTPPADRASRTLVCTVLFLDIVEYSKKSVADQLQVKERLNARIAEAIADVSDGERILLDTGDGLAINFLGDPEDALLVALNLAESVAKAGSSEPRFELRVGINLGPVRLLRDINGQPNIVGDGINVAQRVMSFAQPGQALASRSYHEVVSRISEEHSRLFVYQGSRTDKNVREHEIYAVAAPTSETGVQAVQRARARKAGDTASRRAGGARRLFTNRGLAVGVTVVSVVLLAAAVVTFALPDAGSRTATPVVVANPAPGPTRLVTKPFAEPAAMLAPVDPPPAATELAAAKTPRPRNVATGPRKQSSEARATHRRPEPQPLREAALIRPEPQAEPPAAEPPVAAPSIPAPEAVAALAPASTPPAAKPRPAPSALVMLAISPWGEVYVDGKSAGVSPPLREIELAPGKHTIVVRNGDFKAFQEDVELRSNQTLRIKHKFIQR
jgi:class 3 adenylate cyclase